jgi:hypothetical protein
MPGMGDEIEMTMQQAAQPTLHSMHKPPFFRNPINDHSMAADSKQSIRMQKISSTVLT